MIETPKTFLTDISDPSFSFNVLRFLSFDKPFHDLMFLRPYNSNSSMKLNSFKISKFSEFQRSTWSNFIDFDLFLICF